jgi:hypothetical protein
MLHKARTIALDDNLSVTVGYTMCFSAPTAQFMVNRKTSRPIEIVAAFSVSSVQLDELIAALSAVRDEVKRHSSAP